MKKNKKNSDQLVTKKYLNTVFDKRFQAFEAYFKHELEPLKKMSEEFYELKNGIYDKLDWLIGAFKKFNEEHTTLTEQNSRFDDQLTDHESRLQVLEKRTKYT